MATMSHGTLRKKTRSLGRECGRLTVSGLTSSPSLGDRVVVKINARYGGAPHPRYRGKSGKIIAIRGKGCVIKIMDGGMEKELSVLPYHLKKGE